MERVEDLKRRYVFRIAGSFLVGARLLTQVAMTGLSLFGTRLPGLRVLKPALALRHASVSNEWL
jgi:hypothetical protein